MTNPDRVRSLRTPSNEDPLRILISACLAGELCGYDGTNNGEYPSARKLLTYPNALITLFCPEEFSFGAPRELCDIYGGDGHDVLEGRAKVLAESGADWTAGMIRAAEKMLELAIQQQVEIAVMMDISAACGSTVVYEGSRLSPDKKYQAGAGVCAALLQRHGIPVISQRDFASLETLYAKLDPGHLIDPTRIDHRDTEWYRTYFSK